MWIAPHQSVSVRHDRRVSLAGFDPRDLCPLNADPSHQAFLIKDESIGIVLEGRRREILGNPLIHNDHGWAHANLPAIRAFKLAECVFVHEEHGIAVGLSASLQPPRPGKGGKVVNGLTAAAQLAVAIGTAKDQARFHDGWEH